MCRLQEVEAGGDGPIIMLAQDADGAYIIDRDGPSFRYVLNYLRNETDIEIPLPAAGADRQLLAMEAEYYMLEQLVEVCRSTNAAGRVLRPITQAEFDVLPQMPADYVHEKPPIGRQLCPSDARGLSFANMKLQYATLVECDFRGCDMRSCDFAGTNLRLADLSGADMSEAIFTAEDVYFDNHANLSNANLSNANLSNADLSNANLSGADLSNANLRSAKLSNANLSGADMSGATLTGRCQLADANLSNTCLAGAILDNANLRNLDLSNANLSGADLSNAHLSSANLSNANLSGADMSGAHLDETILVDANLSGADLTGADIAPDTNLSGACLRGATLKTLMRGDYSIRSNHASAAKNWAGVDLDGCIVDEATSKILTDLRRAQNTHGIPEAEWISLAGLILEPSA